MTTSLHGQPELTGQEPGTYLQDALPKVENRRRFQEGSSGGRGNTVILDNGSIPGGWDIDTAVESARQAAAAGRTVLRIMDGDKVILDGECLRQALANQ